jgi:exosortase
MSHASPAETSLNSNRASLTPSSAWIVALAGASLLGSFLWSYWPTLKEIVAAWEKHADYSHGYLVAPIALFFAWTRRTTLPSHDVRPHWIGLIILGVVLVGRYIAGLYYMEAVDGWTIPLWMMGAVCLFFGLRVLWWSLPSIVFLWFMVPLPYGAERLLSLPLQTIATKISTAALRMLNLPAIAEGHTIRISEQVLEVERACSGLRIMVGTIALAFAFMLFSRWAWWQKGLALMAAVPIAILANTVRIIGTGFLMVHVSGDAANRFTHDVAGWIMIPLAALMFWGFLVYLERLFPLVHDLRPRWNAAKFDPGP